MPTNDISEAKNPAPRASMAALQRAALQARKTAIATNTHLVIVKDGQLVRIPPQELRKQLGAMQGDAELKALETTLKRHPKK